MAKICNFPSSFLAYFLVVFVPRLSMAVSPAAFVFGDSILDVGTNDFIPGSKAVANFPPNGIDFANSTPTGRFSNGLNSADFLAKLVSGAKATSPPPFLSLLTLKSGFEKSILRGVNFASGGSGLLDVTGETTGVVTLTKQIKQFATVRDNLTAMMGPETTQVLLSKSMFFISTGGNDLIGYITNKNVTEAPSDFIVDLIEAYKNHIRALYELGARKFAIVSVGPLGCIPSLRVANVTGGCLEAANTLTQSFHYELDALLTKTPYRLTGMKYALGNSFEVITTFIANPHHFKLKDVEFACCGTGKLNAEEPCTPTANLCSNRDEYLFWDRVHPTQFASKLATKILSHAGPRFVRPINFAVLEKL